MNRHARILLSWGIIAVTGIALFGYAKMNVNRRRWLEMKERDKLRAELDDIRRRTEIGKF
jgi:hypothetical protein